MKERELTFAVINPVFVANVRNKNAGYEAVLTMMSSHNYGLIAYMCDSRIGQDDFESLENFVARPLFDLMDLFINSYKECMKSAVDRFAPADVKKSCDFKVFETSEFQLNFPPGYQLPTGKQNKIWYVYIAPKGVPYTEFLAPISEYLN